MIFMVKINVNCMLIVNKQTKTSSVDKGATSISVSRLMVDQSKVFVLSSVPIVCWFIELYLTGTCKRDIY